MEKAYFAAGCFWGVEDLFMKTEGVLKTAVGYMGGFDENPTYRKVCAGNSGHTETVELEFDPNKISYQELLEIFFSIHNPTTKNRQGPDIGSQYRSEIFTTTELQEKLANQCIEKLTLENKFNDPIVTIIETAKIFYRAEDYHQQYFLKNGGGACGI